MERPEPAPRRTRDRARRRARRRRGLHDARRCAAGPLGRAGDRPDGVPGPGASGGRGAGDVPAHDDDALGPRRGHRPRLLDVRDELRLRHLRGRHRPLLGAVPRARIALADQGAPAGRRDARAGAGRDGRRLGLRVQPARHDGHERPRAVARRAGLLPPARASVGRRRGRGRGRGRLRARVPGRRRPAAARRLRRADWRRRPSAPAQQPRRRRAAAGDGRARVRRPRDRLPARAGRRARGGCQSRERNGRHHRAGRRCPLWPRAAPRHRRRRRAGRGRRRHRRDAAGRERARNHRGRQGAPR